MKITRSARSAAVTGSRNVPAGSVLPVAKRLRAVEQKEVQITLKAQVLESVIEDEDVRVEADPGRDIRPDSGPRR